jgi:hypothetical protein
MIVYFDFKKGIVVDGDEAFQTITNNSTSSHKG